jgi:hypothetical protein
MVVIEPYVALTLLVLAVVAASAAVVVLGVVVAQLGLSHRGRRQSRRESMAAYDRRLVPGH